MGIGDLWTRATDEEGTLVGSNFGALPFETPRFAFTQGLGYDDEHGPLPNLGSLSDDEGLFRDSRTNLSLLPRLSPEPAAEAIGAEAGDIGGEAWKGLTRGFEQAFETFSGDVVDSAVDSPIGTGVLLLGGLALGAVVLDGEVL